MTDDEKERKREAEGRRWEGKKKKRKIRKGRDGRGKSFAMTDLFFFSSKTTRNLF